MFKSNRLPIAYFLLFLLFQITQHGLILLNQPDPFAQRTLANLMLGLGYDFMHSGLLAFLLGLLLFSPSWLQKAVFAFTTLTYITFNTSNYHYFLNFGTHTKFIHISYLEETAQFGSSVWLAVMHPTFWVLFVIPLALTILALFKIRPIRKNTTFKQFLINSLFFLAVAGAFGSFSNSYVSKNINNPLTSNPFIYLLATFEADFEEDIPKPDAEIAFLRSYFGEEPPIGIEADNYPLMRHFPSETCTRSSEKSELGELLCGALQDGEKPNIMVLFIESYRSSDMGIFGGDAFLSQDFEELAKEGILFTNFYANGYQTKHGEIATFCGQVPNYGLPEMTSYFDRGYFCLTDALKILGYSNSFFAGSDLQFDNQYNFLRSRSFDTLLDNVSPLKHTEVLGWGLSDEALYNNWLLLAGTLPEPFFSSALTMTNHHPFEVPDEYKISPDRGYETPYFESYRYSGIQVRRFIEKAKNTDWYKNTLIFIMADTSNFEPSAFHDGNYNRKDGKGSHTEALNHFEYVKVRSHIPLLLIGGLVSKPMIIERYASQIDLAPTMLDLLGKSIDAPWAGSSLLKQNPRQLAFTNRPGSYWAILGKEEGIYASDLGQGKFEHFYRPDTSEIARDELRKLGEAWLKVTKWALQSNSITPPKN